MRYKIIVILFAFLSVGFQSGKCDQQKEIKMSNQPLTIKAECTGNEQCLFEGKDIFIDIKIINNTKSEIGFPLEFVKSKGPITRLIDNKTKAETYVPTHPANGSLIEKYTIIKPGESAVLEWVLTSGELQEFGGNVDVSAEFTIIAPVQVNKEKTDFRGSDTIRIVSKNKQSNS